MSGVTYTSNIYTGIVLSNAATQNPVTIAYGVKIESSGADGAAVFGQRAAAWTLTNLGAIEDIASASVGVYLEAGGSVDNAATGAAIAGYAAGIYARDAAATVTNAGNIVAEGTSGIAVKLGAGGTITNAGTGSQILGERGVYIEYGAGIVTNAGTITGTLGAGVDLFSGGSVDNSGTAARIIGGLGVYVTGGAGTVTNDGVIEGNGPNVGAVDLYGGGSVDNSGTAAVISGAYRGVYIQGGAGTVTNTGRILGGTAEGVVLRAGGSIANSGTSSYIEGATDGIYAETGGAAIVTNDGTIAGNGSNYFGVALAGGGTIVDYGTITGAGGVAIQFRGSGHNLLALAPGYAITGKVQGLSGTNELALMSAAGAGTLSGLGTKFYGFEDITVDGGAYWVLSGADTIEAGVSLTILGTLTTSGFLINAGTIAGEVGLSGGYLLNKTGETVAGSRIGVYGAQGVGGDAVINDGTIIGTKLFGVSLYDGGSVTNATGASITGYFVGVNLYHGAEIGTVVNAGTIGAAYYGVRLQDAGTVVNYGTISGGLHSVLFGSAADTLVVEAGSVLEDSAVGGGGTLELGTAAGAGTLTGLGSTYTGFAQYQVVSGATWTLSGANTIGAGATLAIDGRLTVTGSLTNAGAIAGDLLVTGGGSVDNSGMTATITGYLDGVYASGDSGAVTNAGTIIATGTNGTGVDFADGGSIDNTASSALIESSLNAVFVQGLAGTVTNAGTITGSSGSGIFLDAGGSVSNTGTAALIQSDAIAIFIGGGTGSVTNAGTIAGTGASGLGIVLHEGGTIVDSGTIAGAGGTAIEFGGSGANLLSLTAGYAITGKVFASGGSNTLELASAAGTGTLSGLGTRFTGFQIVEVDSKADWLLSGANTIGAGVRLTVAGRLAVTGDLVNSGRITGEVTLSGAARLVNSGTMKSGADPVFGTAGAVTVVNSGTIESTGASKAAIELLAGGTLDNSGTKALVEGAAFGLYVRGGVGRVTNQGTIGESGSVIGVELLAGGTVANSGTAALIEGEDGVLIHGAGEVVTNSGTILASATSGVTLETGGTLTNAGTAALIEGAEEGIEVTGGTAIVTNAGTIEGSGASGVGVDLGGNGTIVNHGTIIGQGGTAVLFGSGTDVLVMAAGSEVVGRIEGGSGNDTFEFTAGGLTSSVTLSGGAGTDTLEFTTAGTIAGSAFAHVTGIDVIRLADGSNRLSLSNVLAVGSDHKKLVIDGGTGDDVINASAVLAGTTLVFNGDGGTDSITGGRGANFYDFANETGTLTINNAFAGGTAAHGDLAFGAGLTDQTLWFLRSGSNLVAEVIGTGERVTLDGWFGSNASARVSEITAGGLKLDAQVAQLVAAMASFQASHPGFNPTASGTVMPINVTLQQAIAAAWHH